jgi:hypothetical protein
MPMDIRQRLENPRERVYLPELLSAVAKEKNADEKIFLLRAFANKSPECFNLMRDFVQLMWTDVKFDLPNTPPPYKTEYPDYTLAPSTLTKAFKRVQYFVPGHPSYISTTLKREQIYIQTLESLFKDDAELYLMIKDKKLDQKKYKGINEALIRSAFAGFLPPKKPEPEKA